MQRFDSDAIRSVSVRLGVAMLLVLVFREPAAAGVNRWTSLGPSGGYVQDLAVDPSDASRVFAATQTGLFRTTDGGVHWLPTSVAAAGAVAISPSDPNVVYTDSFRSGDGGLTWQPMTSLFGPGSGAQHVAVDPSNPRIVHAGYLRVNFVFPVEYHAGVATSQDGGNSWTVGFEVDASTFFGASAVSVITDEARPNDVYAAMFTEVSGSTVYVSRDRGRTWLPGGSVAARFSSLGSRQRPRSLRRDSGGSESSRARTAAGRGVQLSTGLRPPPRAPRAILGIDRSSTHPPIMGSIGRRGPSPTGRSSMPACRCPSCSSIPRRRRRSTRGERTMAF